MHADPKDNSIGLYEKFQVIRRDGRSEPGEKHAGCYYFVLDTEHDPYSLPALRAYQAACQDKFPELAHDLQALVVIIKSNHPEWS